MKVQELIEYLQTKDQGIEVGFLDHFGEFHPLRAGQLSVARESIRGIPKGKEIVVIYPPDFGPEPD